MKKQAILVLVFVLPLVCWGQKETNFLSILEKEAYTNTEWTFLPQMKAAAKQLDKCSKNKCSLTDPVKNKKSTVKEQVNLGWSWGTSQSSAVQKNMAQFEKRLLKSNKFSRKKLTNSFDKHPGYSYKAMVSRFRFHIQSMESIEDDE